MHTHSSSSFGPAFYKVVRSWASKMFMTGCVILLPIAITFYITWWFIHFVDGFFSPIYAHLGINIFGLGFVTSIMFIFMVGVFMSSWLGASILSLGEWFIKRMPFNYYAESCPNVSSIVKDAIINKLKKDPRIGASMLRLHFHDCFVNSHTLPSICSRVATARFC
ncbi:hypothetical protein MKW94_010974 [Papaver nudicaule]|uniref:Plant heme peroxidase family profile domain-containing protein n=1 Tax=Papaver nudicaule TaxID=74823 RepID=A0AA41RXH3_PAPNU|nr:hypothetical protein [Papaver nudicaule]